MPIDRARLIDDVLARLPAHERRRVMGEAIRNAGTLDLPPEHEAFVAFVRGPFARAAEDVLGSDRATSLVDEIVSKLETARTNVSTLPLGGYSLASDLRRTLGRAAPQLVLLGGTLSLHAPRPGVTRVVPKQLDVSVALAIEGVATGG